MAWTPMSGSRSTARRSQRRPPPASGPSWPSRRSRDVQDGLVARRRARAPGRGPSAPPPSRPVAGCEASPGRRRPRTVGTDRHGPVRGLQARAFRSRERLRLVAAFSASCSSTTARPAQAAAKRGIERQRPRLAAPPALVGIDPRVPWRSAVRPRRKSRWASGRWSAAAGQRGRRPAEQHRTASASTTARAISSWMAKTSVSSRSYVSRPDAGRRPTPSRPSAVIRMRFPTAGRCPRGRWVTPSFRPISASSTFLPLEAEATRSGPATRSPSTRERAFRISSAMPSDEVLLVLARAHVGEGQHRDGRAAPGIAAAGAMLGGPLPGVPGAGSGGGDGEHGGGHRERQQEPGPAEAGRARARGRRRPLHPLRRQVVDPGQDHRDREAQRPGRRAPPSAPSPAGPRRA